MGPLRHTSLFLEFRVALSVSSEALGVGRQLQYKLLYMVDKNIKTKDSGHGKVFFNWSFREFEKHERKQGWYVWSGIAVGFLLLYSIVSQNYIFGLITIIATLTFAMFQRSDNQVDFSISEDGILVNNKFYEYRALQSFYIIYIPPAVKVLYIEPKSVLSPRIPVYLKDQDPVKIRKVLLEYLEEDLDQDEEPISDQASRMFKL